MDFERTSPEAAPAADAVVASPPRSSPPPPTTASPVALSSELSIVAPVSRSTTEHLDNSEHTPLASSVSAIVAPRSPLDDLDVDTAANSPAVSSLLLASSAPSVSPVVVASMSAASGSRVTLPLASAEVGGAAPASGPSKPKGERVKPQMGMNGGRWTEQEHQSFLAGLRLYGREWKKVASKIKTRTSAQIRSHAQKYFAKLARDDEMRKHNGLLPAGDSTAVQGGSSLFGYYSDDGSSVAVNSGDEGADTDSSTSQRSASAAALSKLARASGTSGALSASSSPAPSGASAASSASSLVALLSTPAAAASDAPAPSKKRARVASAIGTAMSLQPLAGGKGGAGPSKQRKVAAREACSVGLLPSQEELLEKVSPNIRQRLSSLIEAELCALQVLSCSALLQRHGGGAGGGSREPATAAAAAHSGLLGLSASLPPAVAAGSANFPVQPTMGLGMLATEQMPSMPSIY